MLVKLQLLDNKRGKYIHVALYISWLLPALQHCTQKPEEPDSYPMSDIVGGATYVT